MPFFSLTALPSTANAGRIKYGAGWRKYGKSLKKPALYYSFSGSLRFVLDKTTVLLPPRAALLLTKGTSYSVYAEEDCDYCYFHFEMEECDPNEMHFTKYNSAFPSGKLRPRETDFFLPEKTPLFAPREQIEHLAVSTLRHVSCTHTFDKTRLDLALLRLLLLLGESYALPATDSPASKRRSTYLAIHDYIETRYPESLSLASISKEMNISPQYAARIFRRHAAQSVTTFIQSVRLGKAQELLRYTPLSISEISYAVGFSSPYYFTRLFRRAVGASPSDFRRAAREEL